MRNRNYEPNPKVLPNYHAPYEFNVLSSLFFLLFSLHQYHYFLLFISNRKGSGSAFMFHHSVLKIFSNLFVSHLIAFSLSHTIMSNYKAAVVLQPESLYYFVSELLLPHRNDLDQTFQYNYICICTKHNSENQTDHDIQEHNISSLESLLYNWYLYQ